MLRRVALMAQGGGNVVLIGNVRANSVKRVAAAVGEGSVCVQLVHKVLARSAP